MPAIESLLAALAATANPEMGAQEKNSGSTDGFERAMTDALAPDEKTATGKPAAKLTLKPGPLAAGKLPPTVGKMAAATNEESPATRPATKAASGKKIAAPETPTAPNISGDVILPAGVMSQTLPLPAPLPPANFWAGSQPGPADNGKKVSVPVPVAAGKTDLITGGQMDSTPMEATQTSSAMLKNQGAQRAAPVLGAPVFRAASKSAQSIFPVTQQPAAAQPASTLQTPMGKISPEIFVGADFTAVEAAKQTDVETSADLPTDNLPAGFDRPEFFSRADFFAPASSRDILSRTVWPTDKFSPMTPTPAADAAEKNPATVLTLPGTAKVLQVPTTPAAAAANDMATLMNQVTEATTATETSALPAALPDEKINSDADFQVPPALMVKSENSGTRIASSVSAMKNTDKVEVLAGFAGQKLPDAGPVRLAPGLITRSSSDLPPRISEQYSSEAATNFFNANVGGSIATANVSTSAGEFLPTTTEMRTQTAERTHDLVSLHALRLVESKADSLSVVLKPDAGTELSLQLHRRDGVVEAQAFLTRGDHQVLNQHWADLQSRLELHGVKLAPLGSEGNFNAGGNGFSRQRSPERDAETESALAFAEFAVATGGATARSAGLHGWESWA